MRACDAAGIMAGFPALVSHDIRTPDARTVEVGIRTWMERQTADHLANGAPCISYKFAGEVRS